jgi:hypothetical protein
MAKSRKGSDRERRAWRVQRPSIFFTACKAFARAAARLFAVALLLVAVWLAMPAAARSLDSLLIVADGAEYDAAGYSRVVTIGRPVVDIAAKLADEIEAGQIEEDGPHRPARLTAFSDAVLAEVPELFGYKSIQVVSQTFLPIELVRKEGIFLGDTVAVSHEFALPGRRFRRPLPREVVFASYVIEAAMPMPEGQSRTEQDIVQVALELQQAGAFPVRLNLDPAPDSLRRGLTRNDIAILHVDTHGAEKGRAIQTTHAGDLMSVGDIPRPVRVPLVLLFGCEGVADGGSFGSVLRTRGAEAVVSSFAKFESFGLTGDPAREKRIYQAFFAALRSGENVANALLRLRQAARDEMKLAATRPTLTRNFFALVGNGQLRFKRAASAQ